MGTLEETRRLTYHFFHWQKDPSLATMTDSQDEASAMERSLSEDGNEKEEDPKNRPGILKTAL